jgi:hypothetical protein
MKTYITIWVSLFFISVAFAQDAMKEIKVTKEWKINPNSTFELSADNSEYKIEFWDKENVRIDFILKTNKSSFTSKDLEDVIEINATASNNKLSIHTNIDLDKTSSIWDWIVKTKDKITKNAQYETHNIIYLPKNIGQLNLNLNYCDVNIGNINIPLKLSANYSDVTMLKNNNKTIISSSYSDMKIGSLTNLKINSTYGDFTIDYIDTLNSSTSYCDIKLTNCPFIQNLSTNYGDITIQKTNYVKASASYSDIIIKSLQQELLASLTYSDLNIEDISKNLKAITVTSTYSDNKIKINPENPINIKISDVNGDIDIKNTRLQLNISRDEVGTITNIVAKSKTATENSPLIKFNSNNSDIIIY